MSKILYTNDDNFSVSLKGGALAEMKDGILTIGDTQYEEHEDDMYYPIVRELAALLHQYACADAEKAAPQDAPGSAEDA